MLSSFKSYLFSVKQEFNKIVWSDKRQAITVSVMVFAMVALMSLYFFALDWILSNVVEVVLSLGE